MKKLVAFCIAATLVFLFYDGCLGPAEAVPGPDKPTTYDNMNIPGNEAAYLTGYITPVLSQELSDSITTIDVNNLSLPPKKRIIYLLINSPGGDLASTVNILNSIYSVHNSRVVCVALGQTASGAAIIFTMCPFRIATFRAQFLHHLPSLQFSTRMDLFKARLEQAEREYAGQEQTVRPLYNALGTRFGMGKPDEFWTFLQSHDPWIFSTQEAATYKGFLTAIVKNITIKIDRPTP